jgi:sirohydrochlorin ferrochelatase
MKALLFISHGSRSKQSTEENKKLALEIAEQSGISMVEYAFLELQSPSIFEGAEACIKRGARKIIVLQHFLNSGKHILKDIPEILAELQKKYSEVSFHKMPPIGLHKDILKLYLDQISKG